MLKAVKQLSLQ